MRECVGGKCDQERQLFYLNSFVGLEDLVSLFHLYLLCFIYP